MEILELEVIVKVAERCNLDCHYCYFFHGGNESFAKHPPLMSEQTLADLIRYLNEAIPTHGVRRLRIDLHGGEPLLLGKKRFAGFCQQLRAGLEIQGLEIAVQTNGTLIDRAWIDVFRTYDVFVGISLDGPEPINDRMRIDRRGRGSYQRVAKCLELMHSENYPVAALCVVEPTASGSDVYRHFVDDLGLTRMDFLLPDETHETNDRSKIAGFSDYLRGVYDEWANDNNRDISVRYIDRALARLTTRLAEPPRPGTVEHLILKVASNGDVDPTDLLNSTPGTFFGKYNCENSRLSDFLGDCQIRSVVDAHSAYPDPCRSCCWLRVCGGGEVHNRYSHSDGLNNRSIYCDVYRSTFSHISAHLITSGSVNRRRILESLSVPA